MNFQRVSGRKGIRVELIGDTPNRKLLIPARGLRPSKNSSEAHLYFATVSNSLEQSSLITGMHEVVLL